MTIHQPDDAVTVVGEVSEVSRVEYPDSVVFGLDGPVLVGLDPLDSLRRWAARRALVGGGFGILVGTPALLATVLTA